MNRIQYELVALMVDKLYSKTFPPNTPDSVIQEHCDIIAGTIEACGWDTNDYNSEYINHSIKELDAKQPPKPIVN